MGKMHLVRHWRAINCFYPIYLPDGCNYTRILLSGGEEFTDPRKVKSIAKSLARMFEVDWSELRKTAASVIGRSHELPLGLDRDLVVVPVWVRHPMDKDAGAGGYVALDKVVDCEAIAGGTARSRVVFRDGTSLESLNTLSTLRNRLHEAEQVRPVKASALVEGTASGTGGSSPYGPVPIKEEQACLYLLRCAGQDMLLRKKATGDHARTATGGKPASRYLFQP